MLAAAQRSLLELIAKGTPLPEALDALSRFIEAHAEGALASILLLDREGVRLRHGAAPSLPTSYTRAIDGVAIGPDVGSCGTAAFRGRRVVVTDIRTDPLWRDFIELADAHGLRACWSTPIVSTAREVLGTFAVYHREPHEPTARELELVEIASHLARIAVEHARAEEDIRSSEARKGAILESALDCVIMIDHEGRTLEFNAAAERTFGYRSEDVLGKELAALIVPPQLRDRHRAALARWSGEDKGGSGRGALLGERIEVIAMRKNARTATSFQSSSRSPVSSYRGRPRSRRRCGTSPIARMRRRNCSRRNCATARLSNSCR
jgi:GAF domain-containing protein